MLERIRELFAKGYDVMVQESLFNENNVWKVDDSEELEEVLAADSEEYEYLEVRVLSIDDENKVIILYVEDNE